MLKKGVDKMKRNRKEREECMEGGKRLSVLNEMAQKRRSAIYDNGGSSGSTISLERPKSVYVG